MTGLASLAAVIFLCAGGVLSAGAADRIALVATAGAYKHLPAGPLDPLTMRSIAGALQARGYQVATSVNERGAVLRARLARFSKKARRAREAVVVLAGHLVSSRRSAFFLPVEAVTSSVSTVFLRGIDTREFARAAAEAQTGGVLVLATRPALPGTLPGLQPTPQITEAVRDNVVLAFSTSSTTARADIDAITQAAATRLLGALQSSSFDLKGMTAALTGDGVGMILRDPTRDRQARAAREARAARQREAEARARQEAADAERRRRQQELARRTAEIEAANARETATRKAADQKAREAAAAIAAAEKRARAAEAKLKAIDEARREEQRRKQAAELAELRRRSAELAKIEEQNRAEAAARKAAEERAQQAEARAKALAQEAERAERAAKEREAALAKRLAALEQKQRREAKRQAERKAKPQTPEPKYSLVLLKRMDSLMKPDQRNRIEIQLKKKGYLPDYVSDNFGPQTRRAIRDFQKSAGAEPTGYLTPRQFLRLIAP